MHFKNSPDKPSTTGEVKMIKSAYRLAKHGTADLPIQVRSTGYYRVWDGWRDRAIRKNFLELFWCVSGSGEFTLEDGTSLILQADQCCCYFPGDCHRIQALNKFEYYWITFDGPRCAELIKTFSLERKAWNAGVCPRELFVKLGSEIRKPGIAGEIKSSATGYELLIRAKTPDCVQDTMLVKKFISIIETQFDNADLTVEQIADDLGIHRSTLVRNVENICRESPQQYLTEFRMKHAMDLLHDQELSIKEIAARTGFSSANYFGKVFLRTFGKTPTEMRKTAISDTQ